MTTTEQFLQHLHRGGTWAYLWSAPPKGTDGPKLSAWYQVGGPLPPASNGKLENYFGVHPIATRKEKHERSTIAEICAVNCLFAEFDAKDFDGGKEAARAHIKSLALAPSVVIDSGGGWHCYWLLADPFIITDDTTRERVKRVQAAWVAHVRSDDGAKDLARVLRLPGTQNFKYNPPPLVKIVKCDLSLTYTLPELEAEAEAWQPTAKPTTQETARATPKIISEVIPEGQRAKVLVSLAGTMRKRGLSQDEIAAALLEVNQHRNDPPLPESEVQAIAKSVTRYQAGTIAQTAQPKPHAERPDRFLVHWAEEALQPQPPVDWIVEPLFCAGSVSLIVGEGGTKKTYSMIDLAVAVAMGQPWLNFTTKKDLALIVDEESGNRRMAGRLADTLRGHDAGPVAPVGYITLACLNLYDGDDRAELRAAVLGPGAKLVIVDALADIMPGGDENSVKDVQPIFHALRVLAEESQSAIIVIHHSNKVGTYRGSTALKGAVDLMLMVSCDGDRVTFTTEKARDIEPVKFAALANFGPGTFNLSPAVPEERPEHFSKSEAYVSRYLGEHGRSAIKDIQDHADTCSDNAARLAVYSLVRRGKVRRVDSGGPGERAEYDLTSTEAGVPVVPV